MKDYISNTKLEKGDHYYIQTRHKDLFSHYNLIGPEKRSKIQTTCAHAPWASYNTPEIELIQYGRRIGKKVYLELCFTLTVENALSFKYE